MKIVLIAFCLLPVFAASIAYSNGSGVDEANRELISGWACDANNKAQWIHFYDGPSSNNIYLGATTSNSVSRGDVAAFCSNTDGPNNAFNPWFGFTWATPKLSTGNHTIYVYRNTSKTPTSLSLMGSYTINFPQGSFGSTSDPFGVIESISGTTVSGWACDPNTTAAITLDVYIQYDGRGSRTLLGSITTSGSRPDVSNCPSNSAIGFSYTLPSIRGGRHFVHVKARDVGLGNDALLEHYGNPYYDFSFATSQNKDPNVDKLTTCFRVPANWWPAGYIDYLSDCESGQAPWKVVQSQTYHTEIIPPPRLGYTGHLSRVRFDALGGGGAVVRVQTYPQDTYDSADGGWYYEMNPWDYNFQNIETNLASEIALSGATPKVEVTLSIRDDGYFYYGTTNGASGSCPSHSPGHPLYCSSNGTECGLELGPDFYATGNPKPCQVGYKPWLTVVATVVYRNPSNNRFRFVEVVPFFKGNPNESPLNEIGGDVTNYNPRLRTTDSKVSPSISTATVPSEILIGEKRTFVFDARTLLTGAMAPLETLNANDWKITGVYVGTEQYGYITAPIEVYRVAIY